MESDDELMHRVKVSVAALQFKHPHSVCAAPCAGTTEHKRDMAEQSAGLSLGLSAIQKEDLPLCQAVCLYECSYSCETVPPKSQTCKNLQETHAIFPRLLRWFVDPSPPDPTLALLSP